jgi:4-hydroxybenzoyl-CoA thioesterase/acyl-CoA thioester hydrolase
LSFSPSGSPDDWLFDRNQGVDLGRAFVLAVTAIPMPEPFRTKRLVEFRDTDAAGIIHFSTFFFFMESVEHEFLRHVGLSVLSPDEAGLMSWPRVSVSCDFTSTLRFEDVVDVALSVARLGTKSVTYEFEFTLNRKPVAKGRSTAVCCRMSPHGPPVSMAIPEPVAAKLRPFVA